jgi:cell division initiation protein
MGLTPLDVENTKFRTALGGYNRSEVEQFQIRVSQALEGQLNEIRQLQQRIKTMEDEISRYRESEELLRNSVMLAQKTCDELIASARKRATLIQDEALAEGNVIKHQFAELRSQREQFEYAFHGLLTGFINRLEQGNPQLSSAGSHSALGAGSAHKPAPAARRDTASAAEAGPGAVADVSQESTGVQTEFHGKPAGPAAPALPAAWAGVRAEAGMPSEPLADRETDSDEFSAAIAGARASGAPWPGDREPLHSPAGELTGTDIITALINRESVQHREQHEPEHDSINPEYPEEYDGKGPVADDSAEPDSSAAGGP